MLKIFKSKNAVNIMTNFSAADVRMHLVLQRRTVRSRFKYSCGYESNICIQVLRFIR